MCKKNDYARRAVTALVALFIALVVLSATTNAQTTQFTYQGRLTDTSSTANGAYDFQFALYDAGGTQQGANFDVPDVSVNNGVFTAQLDFGASPFAMGADRYLEIRVKKAGDSSYTILSPRQRIASTPYAIRSLTAGSAETATNAANAGNAASLGGTAASQFVQTNDSRLSDARTPTTNSNFYIQNQNASAQSANFNISGTGSSDVLNVVTQYNFGGNRFITANTAGSTFLGRGTPVIGNRSSVTLFGRNAGASLNAGNYNSFFGDLAGNSTSDGSSNAFFGDLAGGSNTIGSRNSIFGSSAFRSNQIGNDNAAFGHEAGLNSSGSSNAFFGKHAGVNEDGSNNAYFGRSAGDGSANGTNNTAVGKSARFGADNLSYATAVGSDAIATSSNTVVLGRSADTAQIPGKLQVTGTITTVGSVGIGTGTTAPAAKLQVSGGDVFVSTAGAGVILRSPNGGCFRLTVTDAGVLSTTSIVCP